LNWLAHIFLSKDHVEYQLGNLLADPLKGRAWEGASQNIIDGMKMHSAIDSFTDSHPVVSLSKSRLKERGYLKGVVIDVLYDHFLTKHWQTFSAVERTEFLCSFYDNALQAIDFYPDKPKQFISGVINSNRLARYGELSDLENAFERIDWRLSLRIKSKDSAVSYMDVIYDKYSQLERDFLIFFPELLAYFNRHELGGVTSHINQ